jgi:proline iminopeptidase
MSAASNIQSGQGYAPTTPFDSGFLPVGKIHQLYYEQYGRKYGKPVIYLHGGPGGHTTAANTIYFNPAHYRIVLLDQRGAGKSKPSGELRENTSQHLIADLEELRVHLQIPAWHMVFGGSWGSTLALLYAQTHPSVVSSLVLRGIFTVRKSELDWNARPFFPEYYEDFVNYIPEAERDDLPMAYHARLTSEDQATRLAAARAWNRWGSATGMLFLDEPALDNTQEDEVSVAHALFEVHYFKHGAWLEEGQLLKKENINRIRGIPGERDPVD